MTNKEIYTKIYKDLSKRVDEYGYFVCNEIEELTGCSCHELEEFQLFKERLGAWLSDPYNDYDYFSHTRKINEFKLTVIALCIAICD